MLNPEEDSYYHNRGVVYVRLGKFKEAISDYNKSLELDPEDEMTYYNRATAYYKLGEYEKSRKDYTKACELGDKDACEKLKKFK